jgi:outer membrane receptor protein involved in Fe transport
MNKITLFCTLLILVTAAVFSQQKTGTITGSVIDKSTGKPIENADVTLIKDKDSTVAGGGTTGADGKFTITGVPPGRFFLRANIVGYNFAVVSGIVVNRDKNDIILDPVKLSLSNTTTEEIVVEDEKSLIELKPDKKVINVSKNLTEQGSTLLDLLREVPSVNVDQDGNVSLRGSEGVKITIDGRQSGLEGQNRNIILEQIPASNVESIELITNPSAKYEAEGTVGIINIVLKKNKQQGFGYNGALGLNVGTGDKYNGQFSINLKNSKFNLYGNYSYDIRNFLSYGFNNRNYYTNSSLSSTSQLDSGRRRGKSHLMKLGLDYSLDKNNLFGLSFNYRRSERSSGSTSLYKDYDLNGNIISDYSALSNETDNGFNYDINANFVHTFSNPKHVLSGEFSYERDKDDEAELNSELYNFPVNNTPGKRNEYSLEDDNDFSGRVDYEHPFSKDIKIETGLKLAYTKRDIDNRIENFDYSLNQFVTDYGETNRFIYKEQINAFYGIFTQQLGSFGYSAGARVEQTIISGELETGGTNFDRNYIDLFPSASISQKIGNSNELQLSYSRRVHRPRHRELNPFLSYNGSNSYRQGNPNLDPEFTDSYEINFIKYLPWATITPGIFYRYTRNEISPQRTLIDSVTTLTMPVNLNNSRSYGGELIISSQPAGFLNINGTLSYFKTDVDANNIQYGLTNSASSWSARGMASVSLPAGIMIQLSYFYRGKRVTAQGTMEPFQMLNAAVKKDFFDKKLSLSLRVNDILDAAKFKIQFSDPLYNEVFERRRDSRTITLNLTYNFGQKDNEKQGRKKKNNNEDNNNDEDEIDY